MNFSPDLTAQYWRNHLLITGKDSSNFFGVFAAVAVGMSSRCLNGVLHLDKGYRRSGGEQ